MLTTFPAHRHITKGVLRWCRKWLGHLNTKKCRKTSVLFTTNIQDLRTSICFKSFQWMFFSRALFHSAHGFADCHKNQIKLHLFFVAILKLFLPGRSLWCLIQYSTLLYPPWTKVKDNTLKILIFCLPDSTCKEQTNAKVPRVKWLPGRGSFPYIAHSTFKGFCSISVRANTAIPIILICAWPQHLSYSARRQNNISNTWKISITSPSDLIDSIGWWAVLKLLIAFLFTTSQFFNWLQTSKSSSFHLLSAFWNSSD